MAPKKVMKAGILKQTSKKQTLMKGPKTKQTLMKGTKTKQTLMKGPKEKQTLVKGQKTVAKPGPKPKKSSLTKAKLAQLGKLSLKEKVEKSQRKLRPKKRQLRFSKKLSAQMREAKFGPNTKLHWRLIKKRRKSTVRWTRPKRVWHLCYGLLKTKAKKHTMQLPNLEPSKPW